jgi:23S rRNA pseudouridine1911/1915/1917 synthase
MAESKKMTLYVESEAHNVRLDLYLSRKDPEHSRSFYQKLIKQGAVLANGKRVKPNHTVTRGEEITVYLPPPEEPTPKPQALPLDIVYEDDWLIVVNKPAGMVVHPAAGIKENTLVNAIIHHCKTLSGVGGKERPGIIHRLDKGTSGLIIVAKTDQAHRFLAHQLATRTLGRIYMALVAGNIGPDKDTIELPIGRDQHHRDKMRVSFTKGRMAITHYEVAKRSEGLTLLRISLKTGRTHQIRVHLSHLGYPVAGDPEYGMKPAAVIARLPRSKAELGARIRELDHQLLHATELHFVHPESKEELRFEAPLPDDFQQIVDLL